MKLLGAVFAGGASRRFGSDKAGALYRGTPLLAHALTALRSHCDACIIVGRDSPGAPCAPDWPAPGLGPVGGLAGALRYAADHGYHAVLSAPVDCIALPADLLRSLEPGPACLAGAPVIGLWPVAALTVVEGVLAGQGNRSMRAVAAAAGARVIPGEGIANINTRDDLLQFESGRREV